MKKNRAIYVASIASTLAMVGCGFKGNTNMQDYSTDIGTKWDALANQIGTHTVAEAPDVLSNRGQITENLKQAPTNFNPTKGGDKYKENKKFAVDYVNKNITKSQATEIVSIRKLSDLLGEELTKENANVTAVPYIERASFAKINDLSGIKTLSGINHNSEFQIAGTLNGKISNKNKAEGTAYVITYKLDNSAHNYTAIVTIPKNNKNEKLPLMMYAHGGDAGLSFSNMATVMQNNLRRAIVAAPAFPGEPICSITTQGGSEKNSFKRSCVNYNGDVMSPSVNAEGVKKSPLDDDVNALLGLHNAITKLARGGMNPKIGGIEVKGENKTSFIADLQKSIAFNFDDPDLPQMKPVAGIKTIAAADSRGGATLLAAIGRTGIMLEQQLSSGINLENLMKNPPVFFSAAALYYAPSSLTVGEFRILFQYMVAGNINETSSYNALPMIPDLKKNPYFTNYKTAPIGQDQKELSELVGWLAASDIAFLAPYISVGMQNWAVTFASLARTMNELNLDIQTKLTNLGENPAAHALGSLFSAISEPNNDGKSLLAYFADRLTEGKDTAAVTALLGNSNAESRDAVKNLFLNLSKDNKVLLPIGKAIATKVGDSKYNYPTSLQNVAKAFEEFKAASQMDIVQKESLQKLMGYIAGVSKQIGVEIAQNANSDIAKKYIKALSDVSNVLTAMQSSPSAMQGLDLATFFADIKKSSASVLASRKAAPGSIIFLHNTQDEVVPYNQSLIAKLAMDSVFESIYKEQEEQTAFVNPLVMSNVPAVGSQFFAFQPDNIFYNIDIGSKNFKGGICLEKDNKGNPASNFSPSAKKCFGGRPLSKLGSGILAHGDAALWTSHLINGSMQKLKYDGSDIEQVHNAMFYGNGMNIPPKKIFTNAEPAELEQIFGMYNTAKNQSEKTMTTINYYVAPKSLEDCNNPAKRTGLCYLVGGSSSVLFNRPLMLDGLQKDLTAGSWNETAQTSAMTPSDVFSAWMDSSVIQVLTSATTKP